MSDLEDNCYPANLAGAFVHVVNGLDGYFANVGEFINQFQQAVDHTAAVRDMVKSLSEDVPESEWAENTEAWDLVCTELGPDGLLEFINTAARYVFACALSFADALETRAAIQLLALGSTYVVDAIPESHLTPELEKALVMEGMCMMSTLSEADDVMLELISRLRGEDSEEE